ncbi:hypothetical protein C0J52_03341 [Blattella germanica]|nr:hypothetical protein C0J52_03341 [Blattella germanica]
MFCQTWTSKGSDKGWNEPKGHLHVWLQSQTWTSKRSDKGRNEPKGHLHYGCIHLPCFLKHGLADEATKDGMDPKDILMELRESTGQHGDKCYSDSAHNPGNMGPENVAKAVVLNEDGRSIRYISNVLGVARNTVNYAIRRYNETGEYGRQGSGQPWCTNERDERYAVSTILRNRHLPATIVARRLAEVTSRK